jgi:hypothetical protein
MNISTRRFGRLSRRRGVAALAVILVALALAPTAGAWAQIYWWQQNMYPGQIGRDAAMAHNHTYNELYFGPSAYYRSQIWEMTPAGYKHFEKWCYGNCFHAHPGYYFDYAYCANRDGVAHFVNRCMDEW